MSTRDDLAARTERFAHDVRVFVRGLPHTISNVQDVKQLVLSSGSVAANQIEADNALGDKDRLMKFRISRKEAKESGLWLRLLDLGTSDSLKNSQAVLNDEAGQLVKIYSTIINRLGG